MEYISTRNNQKIFTFKDIFLKGLADDGGLFIPKSVEPFSKEEINNFKNLSYNDLAAEIINPFIIGLVKKASTKEPIRKKPNTKFKLIKTIIL